MFTINVLYTQQIFKVGLVLTIIGFAKQYIYIYIYFEYSSKIKMMLNNFAAANALNIMMIHLTAGPCAHTSTIQNIIRGKYGISK